MTPNYKKYIIPALLVLFLGATIYFALDGMNFRNLLLYLYFDALFGMMIFCKYSKNHMLNFILYLSIFSILTIISFLVEFGFMVMVILMLDVAVGFLAYKEYSETY